ncbi:MAG: hypothetical protein GY701_21260 [Sulfitobacter sp.]|nr:hypothetical protein [Sulfitobacter sp.]
MLDRTTLLAEFDRAKGELHSMAVTLSHELDRADDKFRGCGGSEDWKQWAQSWGLVDSAGRGRRIVLSLPNRTLASRLWWRTGQYSFEDTMGIDDDSDRVGSMLSSLVDIQDRVRTWPTRLDIDTGSAAAWDAARVDAFPDPEVWIEVLDTLEANELMHEALAGAVTELAS